MSQTVGARTAEITAGNVKLFACANSIQNQKISRSDLLADLVYVPTDVMEITTTQGDGCACL